MLCLTLSNKNSMFEKGGEEKVPKRAALKSSIAELRPLLIPSQSTLRWASPRHILDLK